MLGILIRIVPHEIEKEVGELMSAILSGKSDEADA